MQGWINGPATDGIDDKIKMVNILLKTNIPSFHHSIIPFLEQIRKPQKAPIFSVGCRNSETLINLQNYYLWSVVRGIGSTGSLVI
jgi:hypothetical protein